MAGPDLPARLRASTTVLGALAAVALAALSVTGLVVAEGRLARIDRIDQDRTSANPPAAAPHRSPATAAGARGAIDVGVGSPAASPAEALLAALNADRGASGADPLTADDRLSRAAQRWARRMAATGRLAHQPLDPILDLGFANAGETILSGPPGLDPAAITRAWMDSPPNRSTLLGPAFTVAGVGVATDDEDRVWVAVILAGRAPGEGT